jgi:O-antigen/teichoic acid export membrane protein
MKWLVNLKVTKKKNAVLRLSISSAISQLVTFIFLPILTHIYSPAEYGKLTLIISASAVVISISTLRFETIFMGTKDISDSNNLIKSMVFIALLTSLVSLPIA